MTHPASDSQLRTIHGDLSQRAVADTRTLAWQPSPSGTVWRKRLHLVGPPEAGQVTSLVRYEPGATFPAHDHPHGEEIFVLAGTFSDEHGDWPAGTYLLNPEGFRHAPFSRDGCVLFVKLRQYSGSGRSHVVWSVDDLDWQVTAHDGIRTKILYSDPAFPDHTQLEQWRAGTAPGVWSYAGGVELFVLKGSCEDEYGVYAAHTWLRMPAGGRHRPSSAQGCELYVKTDALPALQSMAEQ